MELQQIVIYTVIKIPSDQEMNKRPFLKICVQNRNINWKRFVFVMLIFGNPFRLFIYSFITLYPEIRFDSWACWVSDTVIEK